MKKLVLWVTYPFLVLFIGLVVLVWMTALRSPPLVLAREHKIWICHLAPEAQEWTVQWLALEVDEHGWNGHDDHPKDFQIDGREDPACGPEEDNGDDGDGEDGNGNGNGNGEDGNGEDGNGGDNGIACFPTFTITAFYSEATGIPGPIAGVEFEVDGRVRVTTDAYGVAYLADVSDMTGRTVLVEVLSAPRFSWRFTEAWVLVEPCAGVFVEFIDPPADPLKDHWPWVQLAVTGFVFMAFIGLGMRR